MGQNERFRRSHLATFTVWCSLACLLAACDGSGERPKASSDGELPPETPTAATPAAGPAGALTGRVTFAQADLPVTEPFNVNIDQTFCAGKVVNETLVINPESKTVKNVVVTINGVKDGKETPTTVRLANKDCNFEPHVVAAVKGSKLEVTNDDPVNHTTQGLLPNRVFMNNSITVGAKPRTKTLRRKGIISMKCDVHKWMTAWVFIHENDYFAVTDDTGSFLIEDVPPGTYNVKTWHEKLGENEKTVTIEGGKTTNQDFSF